LARDLADGGRDVAAASGIPVETLRKIETGRIATPAFFTIATLADTLALDLRDLAHELNAACQDALSA